MLPPGLLMVHDSGRRGKHDVAELAGWQQLDNPFLEVAYAHIVPRGDDTSLINPSDD